MRQIPLCKSTTLAMTIFVARLFCAPAFGQANSPAASKNTNEPAPKLPSMSVVPGELDFKSLPVGSSSPVQTVVVTVDADKDSTAKINATTAGDFTVTPASCEFKGAGKCAFSATFVPKTEKETTSAVSIKLTAGTAEQSTTVGLKGTGIPCGACVNDERQKFFSPAWWFAICPILIVVLLYLAGIILIRWHMIARPTRNLLKAAIEAVRARVQSLKSSIPPPPPQFGPAMVPSIEQIESLLAKADDLIRDKNPIVMLPDYLLWNRGQEISAWNLVHEAEEQMSLIYPPGYEPYVRAELEHAKLHLGQSSSEIANGTAALIDKALNPDPNTPPAGFERLKALLNEALGFLYNQSDTNFSTLISWQNKTIWLTGCAILLIVSLGGALRHEVFFLVGATGGLLSRLSRSLQRADVPTDYGASWTTLFLSPVVGALAGWTGVLLLIVASQLNIVGSALKVDWCNPYCAVALGLALLLGTSERAFSSVLSQLEDKVKASSEAKPSQKSGASKTP